jgi:predicted GIY-YIG superfamily endonuclease
MRNVCKYQFVKNGKVIHRGRTEDLERREREHVSTFGNGHIKKIGRCTTLEAALKWERDGGKRPYKNG